MSVKFNDKQIAEFKEAFEIYDQGGNGEININNTGLIIRSVCQNPTEVMCFMSYVSLFCCVNSI